MLHLSTLLTALAFTNVASAMPVAGDNSTSIEKRLPTGVNLIYFPESQLDYPLALKATCVSMFQTYWDTIGEARPPVYPGTGTIATCGTGFDSDNTCNCYQRIPGRSDTATELEYGVYFPTVSTNSAGHVTSWTGGPRWYVQHNCIRTATMRANEKIHNVLFWQDHSGHACPT